MEHTPLPTARVHQSEMGFAPIALSYCNINRILTRRSPKVER
jgi:hypothetical protein